MRLISLSELDFSFDDPIVLGERQSCCHCRFVTDHPSDKALQFADTAFFSAAKPIIELPAGARAYHLSKLLGQLIRLIDLGVQRTKQRQRCLVVSLQFFRLTKEQE